MTSAALINELLIVSEKYSIPAPAAGIFPTEFYENLTLLIDLLIVFRKLSRYLRAHSSLRMKTKEPINNIALADIFFSV